MTVVLRLRLLDSKSSRFLAGVSGLPALLRSDPAGSAGSCLEMALKKTVAADGEGGGGGGGGLVPAAEQSARWMPRTAPAGTPLKVGTEGG